MFNRKDSIIKAFKDGILDTNMAELMTDFYVTAGKLTEDEKQEIKDILYPKVVENIGGE